MKFVLLFGALLALYGASSAFVKIQEPESRASLSIITQWNLLVGGYYTSVSNGTTALATLALQQIMSLSYWLGGEVNQMQLNMSAPVTAASLINLALASFSTTTSCNNLKSALQTINTTTAEFVDNAMITNSTAAQPYSDMLKYVSGNITIVNQLCLAACKPTNALFPLSSTTPDALYQALINIFNMTSEILNDSAMIFVDANMQNPFIALAMNIIESASAALADTYQNLMWSQIQAMYNLSADALAQLMAQINATLAGQGSLMNISITALLSQFNSSLQLLLNATQQNSSLTFSNETINTIINNLFGGATNASANVTTEVNNAVSNVTQEVNNSTASDQVDTKLNDTATVIVENLNSSSSVGDQVCASVAAPQLIAFASAGKRCMGQCMQNLKLQLDADLSAVKANISKEMNNQAANVTQCVTTTQNDTELEACAQNKTNPGLSNVTSDAKQALNAYNKDGEKVIKAKICKEICKKNATASMDAVQQNYLTCVSLS